MQVSEAIEEYRYNITRLTEATQVHYMTRLKVFGEWCDAQNLELEKLKPRDVGAFIDTLRPRISPSTKKLISTYTLNGYGRVIRAFLSWCAREYEDTVSSRLSQRVVLPKIEEKVIETFTNDHLKALFAACEREFREELCLRDRAILSLLIDTGVRAGELVTLTLGNVHISPEEGWIVVMGKGRKEREIPLGIKSRQALHKYIRRFRKQAKPDDVVFISRFHKPMTVHGLDMIIYRLGRWANVKGVRVSAHTFRHTFAVGFILGGGDVYLLSRMLGHSTVAITENYLKAMKAQQARKQTHSVLDDLQWVIRKKDREGNTDHD